MRKVRITGGEPLTKPNILSHLPRGGGRCRASEEVHDHQRPAAAGAGEALREAGIRRVNISLDTLDPERYAFITRRGSWRRRCKASKRRWTRALTR